MKIEYILGNIYLYGMWFEIYKKISKFSKTVHNSKRLIHQGYKIINSNNN